MVKPIAFVPYVGALLIVSALVQPAFAQSQRTYIVVINRQPSEQTIDQLREDLIARHNLRGRLQHIYRSALSGFSVRLTEQEAEVMRSDP
jgi:hypothetical protein